MTGIEADIVSIKLKDGGAEGYDFIELRVHVPIPQNTAWLPEKPKDINIAQTEWEMTRLIEYEKEMALYREKTAQYQCDFENVFSLRLEDITIQPHRVLKTVTP